MPLLTINLSFVSTTVAVVHYDGHTLGLVLRDASCGRRPWRAAWSNYRDDAREITFLRCWSTPAIAARQLVIKHNLRRAS